MNQERLFNTREDFWELMQHMITIIDKEEMQDYLSDAVELTVGYKISDLGLEYSIVIQDGSISLRDYVEDPVDVLINISSNDFHFVTSGKTNAIQALITKKLRFERGSWDDMLIIGGLPIKEYYLQACKDMNIGA